MKAMANCPRCKKQIQANCEGCITGEVSYHMCKGEMKLVEGIKWKVYPETEKELSTMEMNK